MGPATSARRTLRAGAAGHGLLLLWVDDASDAAAAGNGCAVVRLTPGRDLVHRGSCTVTDRLIEAEPSLATGGGIERREQERVLGKNIALVGTPSLFASA